MKFITPIIACLILSGCATPHFIGRDKKLFDHEPTDELVCTTTHSWNPVRESVPFPSRYETKADCEKAIPEYKAAWDEARKFRIISKSEGLVFKCQKGEPIKTLNETQEGGANFSSEKDCEESSLMAKLKTERKAKLSKIPGAKKYLKTAEAGKIEVGMPVELLILAWGEPRKKTSQHIAGQTRELFQYSSQWVHIVNGKIEGWTNL